MSKLSVLLPCFNNESIIRDCLESIKWADEILIVDSCSTDRTLEICREYDTRIIQHEYIQSARQKNWAIPQCSYEWVLQIDTDERLEDGAREEIVQAITQAPLDLHAFRIPRKNHALGVWFQVADAYPDYQTRLFRRDKGRFQDKQVHAHVQVPGRVGTLQRHILHYGMPAIAKPLGNINRYSRYQADELYRRGKKFHWYQLVIRPWGVFLYYYLWKRGFTAGYRGLLVTAMTTAYDFWTHAKLWEMETMHLESSPK
jgi:glycosyltransferase involved in cell wall biosynthesis